MRAIDPVEELRSAADEAGGQREWARQHGIAPAYVWQMLDRRRPVSDTVLTILGLRRVVTETIERIEDRPAA